MRLKIVWAGLLGVMLAPLTVSAQPVVTTADRLAWDMSDDVIPAQTFTYQLLVDAVGGVGPTIVLTTVQCGPSETVLLTGSTCNAPVPALTMGRHSLTIRARSVDGILGPESDPLLVIVSITPGKPTNPRLKQKTSGTTLPLRH